ncbi:MAG: hypothetical protein HKM93_04900 [Desulfobacteraceae bacterium]|nr:hypothetical protein [Desulfobacteraceae bacterium]
MRILICVCVAMLVAMAGCVAQKPAVEVNENLVHFSIPNFTLSLDDDYEYMDIDDTKDFSFHSGGGLSGTSVKNENHLFVKKGTEKNDMSWISISYATITRDRSAFSPVDLSGMKGALKTGSITLNRGEYTYAVYVAATASGKSVMHKLIAKVVGPMNNRMLKIIYSEDVSYHKDFPYRTEDWNSAAGLTDKQLARLNKFMKNSEREIKTPVN